MSLAVGDVVRVKGIRGPEMVIAEYEPDTFPPVVVFWYDVQHRPQQRRMAIELLELVPIEGKPAEPIFDPNPQANALAVKAYREQVKREVTEDMVAGEDAIRFAHTEGLPTDA